MLVYPVEHMAPVSDKLIMAQGEPHRRARSAAADAAGGRVVPPTARLLSEQQKGEPVFAFVFSLRRNQKPHHHKR